MEALSTESIITAGQDYWKLLDIRAGIPDITAETSEQFLPHYINLPVLQAVSFTKGCYHGQEIIARMQYKAVIKKHMVHSVDSQNNTPEPIDSQDVVMSAKNDNGIIEYLIIKEISKEKDLED